MSNAIFEMVILHYVMEPCWPYVHEQPKRLIFCHTGLLHVHLMALVLEIL